jgi:sugar phosphate isomerase/epimerase
MRRQNVQLFFGKSKWEMWDDPLAEFLSRASGDGFDAVEIYLGSLPESPSEIAEQVSDHGLRLIGQILTQGTSPDEHIRSLNQQFDFASRCEVVFINTHAGRDFLAFEDNLRVFRRITELSRQSGIPIRVETHRGRPTYSAIETRRYLEEVPDLELTADFSHWMVVHESDLSDQPGPVDAAIERSGYVHARVGYAEGPQIPDPRAPEWRGAVDRHVELWRRIVERHRRADSEYLFITPEFGPPDYMHTQPFTRVPVADAWELNVYMRDYLRRVLDDV